MMPRRSGNRSRSSGRECRPPWLRDTPNSTERTLREFAVCPQPTFRAGQVAAFAGLLRDRLDTLEHVTGTATPIAWDVWLHGLAATSHSERTSITTAQVSKVQRAWAALSTTSHRHPLPADIAALVHLVYRVRCRLFHGDKPLDHLHEPDQQRRFVAYTAVLLTILELFFEQAKSSWKWSPKSFR